MTGLGERFLLHELRVLPSKNGSITSATSLEQKLAMNAKGEADPKRPRGFAKSAPVPPVRMLPGLPGSLLRPQRGSPTGESGLQAACFGTRWPTSPQFRLATEWASR